MKHLDPSCKNSLKLTMESTLLQFIVGYFFSIFIAGIFTWDSEWSEWLNNTARFNSLISMSVIFLCSFTGIRRSVFIGELSFRYVFSAFILWATIILGILFVFRFSFSAYYLISSSSIMLIFFVANLYIRSFYHHRVVGYIPIGRTNDLPRIPAIRWVALEENDLLKKIKVNLVMADFRSDLSDEWEYFLADCTLKKIPVYHSVRFIEMISGRVKIDHFYENDFGSLQPSKSYHFFKRILDVSLILLSTPIIIPVMLITALVIAIESRGGVFFLQERIGQEGRPFVLYKFRSMCGTAEEKGSQFAQTCDSRVTRIGKFLRKTRIDELPQFYNVLKGEMSLIGPRPEQKIFVDEFNEIIPFYNYRHIVKPGISGWAQVVHGYAADTEETKVKLEYDFYYIKNFSFSMDLIIFFKTIQTILTGFGSR